MASPIYTSLAAKQQQKASALPWTNLQKPSLPTPTKPAAGGPALNTNPMGNSNTGAVGAVNKATGLAQANQQKGFSQISPKIGLAQQSLGVKAKTPDQNLKPDPTVLPANQVQQPKEQSATNSTNNTNNSDPSSQSSQTDPIAPTPPTPAPAPTTYQTAVGGLAGANIANQQIGDRAKEIGDKAGTDINTLRQSAAETEGEYRTGMIAPRAQGLAQVVAQTEAAKEQGVIGLAQQQLAGNAQALSAQGQTQSAQSAAGSLTQPQSGAAFFGSPETGGQVGLGNSLIDNAVSNAVNLIKSGSSTTDAMATLSALGAPAQQAFINQMRQFDPTWNPTSSNAIAQQNMTTAQQNIASAANIQKSVTILDNLAKQIVPNMGTTGFNPASTPIGNQTFAQYFANKNPAAVAGIKAGLGDIKNQISNVIASATGLTPTGVTGVTDSYDFTQMNPQQLNDFLQYIYQYAQSNMKGAQQGIQGATGGYGAYQGANATPGALPQTKENQTSTALGGLGMTLAKGLIQTAISTAGNAIGEGAGLGLAAQILK